MKFSVVIPCYNSAHYVNKAIESVTTQTNNAEIIVVDDGSTDNLSEVLPVDIIYVRKENGGVSSARNLGVEKASGEYIMFLDSDDAYKDGLFDQLEKVTSEQIDMISWGFDVIGTNGSIQHRTARNLNGVYYGKEFLIKFLEKDVYQHVCSICLKSELIKNSIVFNENHNYAEDINFQIECMNAAKTVHYINQPLFDYINRDGSAITKKYCASRLKIFDLYDETRTKLSDDVIKFYDNFVGMTFVNLVKNRMKNKELTRGMRRALLQKAYVIERADYNFSNEKLVAVSLAKLGYKVFKKVL